MGDGKSVLFGAIGVLVGLVVGGLVAFFFFRPPPAHVPEPHPREISAFLAACRDLNPALERSLPGQDVVLENKLGKSGPTGNRVQRSDRDIDRLHSVQLESCEVTATEDGIAKFLDALHGELKKLAHEKGAIIDVEGKGRAAPPSFHVSTIEYTAGKAFGTVVTTVDAGKAHPDRAGFKTYKLTVRIEEWVP
jgi:hypothetical protein